MNVNSIMLEEYGSGYSVTVRVFVGAEEIPGFGKLNDAVLNDIMAAVLRQRQADDGENELTVSSNEPEEPDTEAGEPDASDGGNIEATDTTPPASPKKGKRGKRGGGKPSASSATESESPPVEDAPPSTSQKRGKRGAGKPTTQAAASGASAAPASKRKASRATSAEPTPATDEVTDEDLVKAVTECARKVGVVAATEIAEQFGVERVQDAPADVRQELLEALMNAEK